jgi:hypothetical protein
VLKEGPLNGRNPPRRGVETNLPPALLSEGWGASKALRIPNEGAQGATPERCHRR